MEESQQPTVSEVSSPPVSPPAKPSRRRFGPWAVAGLVLVMAASAAAYWYLTASSQPPDPRLTFPTRYRNVRPDVAYVGDARCLECHKTEGEHFSHHPMGQSLAPEAQLLEREDLGAESKNPFAAAGLDYQVIKRGDTLWHRETMRGDNKAVVYEKEVEVQYALGSGAHGRSYLHTKDGQVWQSPISWYSASQPGAKGRWDLSPGYAGNNLHFERGMPPDCLNCHVNRVNSISGTLNHYQEPIFHGYNIGCERCHGPGQLHAKDPFLADAIVNPVHLEPVLREAVCQQCHLQGDERVNRIGRDISEYRPGLPLHAFVSVAVLAETVTGTSKAVSQVEQMHTSVCFQKSAGKLGCISCHFHPDPQTFAHQPPTREHKRDYYRQRCLSCHEQSKGCSEKMSVRATHQDSCVACHMPPKPSFDVAHVSFTNHTISRRPNTPRDQPKPLSPNNITMVLFHRDLDDPIDFTQDRDLAVALISISSRNKTIQLAQKTRGALEASLKQFPNDVDGLDALAQLQWTSGDREESLRTQNRVLQLNPRRERTLQTAYARAAVLHHAEEALALCKQLVQVNPNNSESQFQLAKLLQERKQSNEALAAALTALQLNPAKLEARRLLIRCYLDVGQREQAAREFQNYLAFKPHDTELVKIWFDP